MKILVTGGTGYIGSHATLELLTAGHDVTVVDNLSNSSEESLRRVAEITGRTPKFHKLDVCDFKALDAVFDKEQFDAVIHFAGLKAVGESVREPLDYYRNNIDSTLTLCEVMQKHGCKKLIFSSSASVYGDSKDLPLRETSPAGQGITNPYGETKYMIEQILRGLTVADPEWEITALRYFNLLGAHESGKIGDDPNGLPNNLPPYVSQVASGKLKQLQVFGDDYDTPDGTCVRDYIHVVDLVRGHLAAINHLHPGFRVYNLGTGKGASVLDIVHAFEKASGKKIPYKIRDRREGDPASSYADASLAAEELSWHTERTLEEACADAWRWQSINPTGYSD